MCFLDCGALGILRVADTLIIASERHQEKADLDRNGGRIQSYRLGDASE